MTKELEVATKERAMELFQATYFDSVDRYDMEHAVTALHDEIDWSHVAVWKAVDFGPESTRWFSGPDQVLAFLTGVRDKLIDARIRHQVDEMVFDEATGRGAFLGHVESRDTEEAAPMFGWFELRDDKIVRYVMRPR